MKTEIGAAHQYGHTARREENETRKRGREEVNKNKRNNHQVPSRFSPSDFRLAFWDQFVIVIQIIRNLLTKEKERKETRKRRGRRDKKGVNKKM